MVIPVRPKRQSAEPDIDLNALRIFVAIAEAGSFVGGGKVMGLTRSAAGKAIARLEANLGARLLHRTTRRVSMTADGLYFYQRCVQILQDLAEAQEGVRQDPARPKGTLRLSVPETWGKVVILPFLRHIMQEWPELDIEVNFTDRLVDLVEEGFDLAIRVGSGGKDSQLITRVIQRICAKLYASPAYLEHAGVPQEIDDLARHQRLIYGPGTASSEWELVSASGQRVCVRGHSRIRCDSGEAIRAAAVEGLGIAWLPSFLVEADVRDARLVPLLTEYGGEEIAIHVLYPSRKHLAIRVRMFIDRLIDYLH